jgi:hypothetical protein
MSRPVTGFMNNLTGMVLGNSCTAREGQDWLLAGISTTIKAAPAIIIMVSAVLVSVAMVRAVQRIVIHIDRYNTTLSCQSHGIGTLEANVLMAHFVTIDHDIKIVQRLCFARIRDLMAMIINTEILTNGVFL